MKVKIQGIQITSISSCVPKNELNLYNLSDSFGVSEVAKIINTTGIKSIRFADEETTTADLCYHSVKNNLEITNTDVKEIDGLIFVSQTADYKMPQTSHILQHRLGLGENTICYDLPIGCNGYIYGLFQASILIQSGACNKVLVLAGDTTTRIINDKDRSVKMVFGDGASSTILEKGSEDISFVIYTDGSKYKDLIITSGGGRQPYSESDQELIEDSDGNIRTDKDLFMNGMSIFNFAINRVPLLIKEIVGFSGWAKDEVNLFALHQANKFMVDYLRKKSKVDLDKMPVVVDGFGNTGPATIPILLTELLGDNITTGYKKVVMCGFGVGLSWGALTCDLSKTKIIKTLEY